MLWLLKRTNRQANLLTRGEKKTQKTRIQEKEGKQKTTELIQVLLISSGWFLAKKQPFRWHPAAVARRFATWMMLRGLVLVCGVSPAVGVGMG